MGISEKRKIVKKRNKKIKSTCNGEISVRPECLDGMSNWLRMQKVGHFVLHHTKFLLEIFVSFLSSAAILCSYILQRSHCYLLQILQKTIGFENKQDTECAADSRRVQATKSSRRQFSKNKSKISFTNTAKSKPQLDSRERISALMAARNDSEGEDEVKELGSETIRLTKSLALDCEMVGTGPEGKDSMLARVSIVNSYGECIYDTYVKPVVTVTNYRTEISGIRPADLEDARPVEEVRCDVRTLIRDRRVIGHDLKHDFNALRLQHPIALIRDTAKYKSFRHVSNGKMPSLKKLADELLNLKIQQGEHSSIDDANTAMILYMRHKTEWEKSLKRKRRR